MANVNWTREELILAFNLYCKISFGQIHHDNPKVIELAQIIGRTPSSVSFKLSNFASLDPFHIKRGIKGLRHGSKLDKEIYDEFSNNWDELVYESEILLTEKLISDSKEEATDMDFTTKTITERIQLIKARVNQTFFREAILASYNSCCAITGLNIQELLIASHIIPWAANASNRLHPSNGICLNALHDKAFDKGLLTITPDYKIKTSKYLGDFDTNPAVVSLLKEFDNKEITLPNRFLPKVEFLEYHANNIFIK